MSSAVISALGMLHDNFSIAETSSSRRLTRTLDVLQTLGPRGLRNPFACLVLDTMCDRFDQVKQGFTNRRLSGFVMHGVLRMASQTTRYIRPLPCYPSGR